MKQHKFLIYTTLVFIGSLCNNAATAAEMNAGKVLPTEIANEILKNFDLPSAAQFVSSMLLTNKSWVNYLKNEQELEKLISAMAQKFLGNADSASCALVAASIQVPQANEVFNKKFDSIKQNPQTLYQLVFDAIRYNDGSDQAENALKKVLGQLKYIERDTFNKVRALFIRNRNKEIAQQLKMLPGFKGFVWSRPQPWTILFGTMILDIAIQQADGKFVSLFGSYDSDNTFLLIDRSNSDGSKDQTFEQHVYETHW